MCSVSMADNVDELLINDMADRSKLVLSPPFLLVTACADGDSPPPCADARCRACMPRNFG